MTARKMTTVRLNSQTLATLRELRETHGLSSDAAAIEYLAAVYRDGNKNGGKKMKKENGKKGGRPSANDFHGEVYDRMTDKVVAKTRYLPTWESAQRAAGSLAKRKGLDGDRYAIRVN